jgi:hypothetical protein
MIAPQLSIATSVDDLPIYPIAADERLESHFFLPMYFRRWLGSDTRLLADMEVRAAILELFMIAQDQSPVGTLPTDHKLIARLLGITFEHFKVLCDREVSPLRHWVPCRAGDQVRLMHHVVTEVASEAIDTRRDRDAERQARKAAKAVKDLEARLRAMGLSRQADDRQLVEQVDAWLINHCTGYRTELAVRQALDAVSMGRS